MRPLFNTLRRLSCFAMIAVSVALGSAVNAQILNVADSRVQGFFSSQNGFFFLSGPNGMAWQAPPANGNAVAGFPGVHWVPFTLPTPFLGTDNAVPGTRTFCSANIVGGFNAPGNSVPDTFVAFTQMPYLIQEGGAVGVTYLQLNFSIDYNVGILGLLGGMGQARYPVFGRLSPVPGSYAKVYFELTPWFIGMNGIPVQLGAPNVLSYDTRQAGILVGPFAQLLIAQAPIANVPGPGILRLTGCAYWEGDPSEMYVSTDENPEEEGAFITGNVFLDDDFSGDTAAPMTLEFRPTDGGPAISRAMHVLQDGSFLTHVPRKNYTMHVKYSKHLSKNFSVDARNGDISDLLITGLASGDANDDNCVDILDLDLLLGAFDAALGEANYSRDVDFNHDDFVDILDLDLLLRSFDQCGEE